MAGEMEKLFAERVESVHPVLPKPQRIEVPISAKVEAKYVTSLR